MEVKLHTIGGLTDQLLWRDNTSGRWQTKVVNDQVANLIRREFGGWVNVRTSGYKRKAGTAFHFKRTSGYHTRYACGELILCAGGVEDMFGINTESVRGFTLLVSRGMPK
jgi:hypothetical protein